MNSLINWLTDWRSWLDFTGKCIFIIGCYGAYLIVLSKIENGQILYVADNKQYGELLDQQEALTEKIGEKYNGKRK